MFQKSSVVGSTTGNISKLEPDPHSGPTPGLPASNCNERITLAPNYRDKQYVNYQHSNRPKDESKSHHHRLRNSNSHSLSQQSQMVHSANNHDMQASNLQGRSNQQSFNQRSGHNGTHMVRSSTNLQIYQNPNLLSSAQHQDAAPQSTHLDIAARLFNSARPSESPSSSVPARVSQSYTARQRSSSNSTLREETKPAHGQRQDNQQDRDDTVTMIREEMDELASAFKESELETLGSLEKNLPVELSFLIRQQAYCMARMNYLDRQIRELKETKHSVPQQANQQLMNHRTHNAGSTSTNVKNGNGFIPSDDSGGEYSRATISDEDELSSLLDQIAKSVKPERHMNHQSLSGNQQQQLNNRASYSVISSQPQQYAIINPGHMHTHPAATAVPVFVMGSPIAVAHPSSINSNILPGVHFQPEPRYNQYYEDFYIQNGNGIINNDSNSSPSMINTRHSNHGIKNPRPQPNTSQFDTSISAIEQLVSQKEKRQIRSQLKSADNWLKMRSATMCNLNEDFCNDKSESNDELADDAGLLGPRERSKSHQMGSGTGVATENSNSVIEESENNR